jgi:hypothetical protein
MSIFGLKGLIEWLEALICRFFTDLGLVFSKNSLLCKIGNCFFLP